MLQVSPRAPRIAVVDDDPAVRGALAFSLETAGMAVSTFADAEAVLAGQPESWASWDCLVLDQRLPGMSGLDLLNALRRCGLDAPAILITSNPSRQTRGEAAAAGVDIVEKPLLDDDLARKVSRLAAV